MSLIASSHIIRAAEILIVGTNQNEYSAFERNESARVGPKILQEQKIIFTPSSKNELGKSGFGDLKEVVKCAGARSVSAALPKKKSRDTMHNCYCNTRQH